MRVIMVGGSLLFCLVPFLYFCNTLNLAVVVQAKGHGTGGVSQTRLDSHGTSTFELLCTVKQQINITEAKKN